MKTRIVLVLVTLLGVFLGQEAQAYYNPSAGRWLNRDPIAEAGGKNLYSFVKNDSVQHADLVGLVPTTSFYICLPKCGNKTYTPWLECCCNDKVVSMAPVNTGVVKHKWGENPQGPGKYHVWVTWDGGSADSNGDSVVMDPGSQKVSTPAFSTPTPNTSTPIKLSPCKYDFKKLNACLTRKAGEMQGSRGGLCGEFVDRLIDDCAKESKGCTAPP